MVEIMAELSEFKCGACRGDTPLLDADQIAQHLSMLNGWQKADNSIEKTISFTNFITALAFFNRVAELAEEEGHHPDMGIYQWRNVKLVLTTHVVKGLTINDFIIAAKIDKLLSFSHSDVVEWVKGL